MKPSLAAVVGTFLLVGAENLVSCAESADGPLPGPERSGLRRGRRSDTLGPLSASYLQTLQVEARAGGEAAAAAAGWARRGGAKE